MFFEILEYYFQSQIAVETLIEDSQAQVKTIRQSAKWSMLFLTLNIRFFSFLDTILTVLDLDMDPYS